MSAHSFHISGVSDDLQRRFETEAKQLNLTPAAYLRYLVERQSPGVDQAQADRMGPTNES